ncbi:hypothetical protein [Bacillus marasmi]|uniref:hypothetical protein n=1 Tax=Bacillus marasmi TaxID=1926279 RepID=UPI0011CC537E|nr:hypothetical protein [Bacillus marasmi]
MKLLLQQIKEEVIRAYDHPEKYDLTACINELQSALDQYGDKGTMISNAITALTQANNSRIALKSAGDVSSSAAFGQAFNALEQAIESYSSHNNDPY